MQSHTSRPPRRLSALVAQLLVPKSAAAAQGSPRNESFTIEPAPGKLIGAYVRGLSLADGNLSPEGERRIKEAFLKHSVLIFEGQQDLTLDGQIAFGKRFGVLEYEKLELSNRRKGGALIRRGEPAFSGVVGTQAFHMDSTFFPVSAKAGLLYAEQVPSWGGETEWCDMKAAFDALDEETKGRVEKLAAYHSAQYTGARRSGIFPRGEGNKGKKGIVGHGQAYLRPLVKIHPETGRKILFTPAHAFSIPGMSPEESTKFLDDMVAFAASAPPRLFSHKYQVGDLAIWDNRCVLHRARPYDYTQPRVMRSTRVAGEKETESALPAKDGAQQLEEELTRLKQLPPKYWEDEARDQRLR